ncbi:hypothetical protein DSM106972_034390 [Dulcicalothrix desertica PCC 7102]|uniref:FecR protein domain-containing protein n=1 Tax=Dulcicalothrix desertica PCC 7102 TaxID=232991 RepID=A0A3S1B796_9CYAN|nr:FecR domain-containing protein [Dulcicalothrix desertica]RUT06233.1 hypothetical protein DSM106972_034390 [Dulcicalothrix desertica PCC 7102]
MSKSSELQQMFRKLLPLLVISLSGVAIPVSNQANAQTPLTRAVIQDLRNLVQLMPQRQPRRKAQRSDAMTPGDGLSTGRLSLADLRFNDGSWARVGEQAVFQFLPRTRNFTLNNGTVLLLIPPGRGRTNIRTPSAAAAIRGSALFVRYDKVTDTTIVGALTNSGIEVFNKDASSSQVLQAGQMMVVVKGKFQGLYGFDLRTFYDTSDLVRGLDLTRQNPNATSDPALSSVQAETSAALAKQSPISGPGTIKDPSFIKLSTTPEETSNTLESLPESDNVDAIVDYSQVQPNFSQRNNRNNSTTEDDTKPPVNQTPKPEVPSPKPEVPSPKPEVPSPKPEVPSPKPEVPSPKPEVPDPKPEVPNPKPEVPNPKPEVPDPKPEVPNPKPEVPNPKPEVPNPKPEVPNPKPEVPNPKPEVPNPKPEVPNPKPEVPDPKPEVPNPKPEVPDPKPEVPNPPSDSTTDPSTRPST